jgi:hypothetical protein
VCPVSVISIISYKKIFFRRKIMINFNGIKKKEISQRCNFRVGLKGK